jgi:type IV secretion system protein VirB6
MAIEYFNVVHYLFSNVHHLLDHYLYAGYHALSDYIKTPLRLLMVLYVVMLGYGITQGWVQWHYSVLIKTVVKLSIIYTLCINWDFFSRYVVDFLVSGSNEVALVFFKINQQGDIGAHAHSVEDGLQSILTQFVKIGYWLWRRASWHSMSPFVEAILIWFSGIALVLVAAIYFILADVMFAILLILSPLFFAFLIFPVTRSLFDKWLGYLISYAFLNILMALSVSFILNMASSVIQAINSHNLINTLLVTSFIPILMMSVFGIYVVRQVVYIARTIGAGFSSMSIAQSLSSDATTLLNREQQIWQQIKLSAGCAELNLPDVDYAYLLTKLRRGVLYDSSQG